MFFFATMIRQLGQFGISFAIGVSIWSMAGGCSAQVVSNDDLQLESTTGYPKDDTLLIFQETNRSDGEDHSPYSMQRLQGEGLETFPLMLDSLDLNSGQITAGQLWEYFHQQGKTSVDRLKFDLICDSAFETDRPDNGMFRFQVEGADGGMLSSLNLIPANGSLEVPLDYDYMKRFSRDSQEIIRFQLPSNGQFSLSNTQISVASDAPTSSSRNFIYLLGFCGFWMIVFVILNRFTKPMDESSEEIKILSNPRQQEITEALPVGSLLEENSTFEISNLPTHSATQANREGTIDPVSNNEATYRKPMDHEARMTAGSYAPSR